MADSGELLRLLEPAVRPVPQSSRSNAASSATGATGEADFDQQLAQARDTIQAPPQTPAGDHPHATTDTQNTTATSQPNETIDHANNLTALSSIDRVENPTLRQLIEGESNDQSDTQPDR